MERSQRAGLMVQGLILLLTCGAQSVMAEEPSPVALLPGDSNLDGSTLEPFTATYAMKRGGNDWATAVIELRAVQVNGEPAFRHSYALHFTGQTVYDETLFLARTFEPLLKFIHGSLPPDLAYKLYTFNGLEVKGSLVHASGAEPKTLSKKHASPVFASGTDYLALVAAPLKEGYSSRLPVGDDSEFLSNLVRVVGEEQLSAGGRTFSTWKLSVQDGKGFEWLSRRPPYLIRKDFPEPGISWELLEIIRTGPYVKTREE